MHDGAPFVSSSVFVRGTCTQGQEALLVQVRGSLKTSQGFQLALSGDLRNSVSYLSILPPVLGLDGALGLSDNFVEGRVSYENVVHSFTI